MTVSLVQHSEPFALHSGQESSFKFECDALTEEDCIATALWLLPLLGAYGSVEPVASSGPIPGILADAFRPHVTEGARTVLVVDDVLTTGASMEAQRAGRLAVGAVIFARGPCPAWVHPLFILNSRCRSL